MDIQIKHTTIKFNQHFIGILNSWIVLHTKYMKLNVQRINMISQYALSLLCKATLESSLSSRGYLRIRCTGLMRRAPMSNTTWLSLSRSTSASIHARISSCCSYCHQHKHVKHNHHFLNCFVMFETLMVRMLEKDDDKDDDDWDGDDDWEWWWLRMMMIEDDDDWGWWWLKMMMIEDDDDWGWWLLRMMIMMFGNDDDWGWWLLRMMMLEDDDDWEGWWWLRRMMMLEEDDD